MSWIGKQNVKFFLLFLHTVLMKLKKAVTDTDERSAKTVLYISVLLFYSYYMQMSSAKQQQIKKCKKNWTELRMDKRNKVDSENLKFSVLPRIFLTFFQNTGEQMQLQSSMFLNLKIFSSKLEMFLQVSVTAYLSFQSKLLSEGHLPILLTLVPSYSLSPTTD